MYQSQYFCTCNDKNRFIVHDKLYDLKRLIETTKTQSLKKKYRSCLTVIMQILYYAQGFERQDFDDLVNSAEYKKSLLLDQIIYDLDGNEISCDTEIVKNITGAGIDRRISGQRIFELRVNVADLGLGVRLFFFTTDTLGSVSGDYQCYVSIFQKNWSEVGSWNLLTSNHVKIISDVYNSFIRRPQDYQHCFEKKWRVIQ